MSNFEIVIIPQIPDAEFIAQKKYVGELVRDGWTIVGTLLVTSSPRVFAVFLVGEALPDLFEQVADKVEAVMAEG